MIHDKCAEIMKKKPIHKTYNGNDNANDDDSKVLLKCFCSNLCWVRQILAWDWVAKLDDAYMQHLASKSYRSLWMTNENNPTSEEWQNR